MYGRPGGTGSGDGVPLITRLLLLRATVGVDLSPSAPLTSSARETALMMPKLRIVSHYAQGPPSTSVSSLRPATTTPEEDARFLEAHPSLKGLLSSLAAGRLAERAKLRRLQTDVVRTSVKLTRAAALSSSMEDAPASHSSSRSADYSQLQGVLAAATANFAEDAACFSTITPHSPQLNSWCFLPVSAEGCYVTVPSSPFVQWCRMQAMRHRDGEATVLSVEPRFLGGPMRYSDIVHYASATSSSSANTHTVNSTAAAQSASADEDSGYVHGYAFILEGDVFTGSGGVDEAAAVAAMECQLLETSLRGNSDEKASVLVWCLLSDAPVYNFMRALTHEAVSAMSYVAQRLYNERVGPAVASPASAPLPSGVYTALLDDAIQEEVVRPLARELLIVGSVSSRTLPGETFTVQMAPKCSGRDSGGGSTASHPPTSSMQSSLTFRRPLDLPYPHADVPLSPLLLSFNEDALRVLQSLLMQEARVVVLGATPQHASACVVSLAALLSPLTWVSPLVPFLPPHLSAVTGLLETLLQCPFELRQPHAPPGKSLAPLPASHRSESSGFLVGSTAAIQPYLLLLSSSTGEAGMGARGHSGADERALRVWIADARTGCIGACPEEPVARFSRTDYPPSANLSDGSTKTAAKSSRAISAWTSRARVNLRLIAPHCYERDGNRNIAALYGAVRSKLRAVAESNVMDAAPLDLLPAFSDDLRHLLRRVVSIDKRRLFRHSLEAVAQHTQARLEGLESLAARLARGLRLATTVDGIGSNIQVDSVLNDSFEGHCSYSGGEGDDKELTETRTGDAGSSPRAMTGALSQSFSKSFPGAGASSVGFFAAAPPPQFPVLSPSELWQVQAGFFDYMVRRFTGAYRRGLSTTTAGGGGSCSAGGDRQCRAPTIESSVFLVPGMDQNHALAKRVAHTHTFKQFECALLAAELPGLCHVFSGSAQTHVSEAQSVENRHGGAQVHPLLANTRSLALFALFLSRARLHYAELYGDLASVDAVGLVYTSMVMRWFASRSRASSSASVPSAIKLLAGGYTAGEGADADVMHGGGGDDDGGGGGNLRGFLSKVAKKVKHRLNSGGGSSGHGSSSLVRGLQAVCLPAAIACLHSFRVPPFSQLPKSVASSVILSHSDDASTERRSGAGGAAGGHRGRLCRRRHRNAHAFLSACTALPERAEWIRKQEQQQSIALDTEFALQDCVSVLQAAGFGGGGYGDGSAYGSGVGIKPEVLGSIACTGDDTSGRRARAGITASTQWREIDMRAASEASLYICRALPLDIVHQFDAYEPLLRPVPPGGAPTSSRGAGGDALEVGSAEAYMRIGVLCPTCVNVWCEGEARAVGTLLEQSHPRPAKTYASAASSPASSAPSQSPTAPPAWSAFTSGASQDCPFATPAASGGNHGGDAQQHQAASVCASEPASSLWSNATGPIAAPPASESTSFRSSPSHHRGAWDFGGLQAPSVVAGMLPTPVQGAAIEKTTTSSTDRGGSGSASAGGCWSTGAPFAPPMMLDALPPYSGFAPSPTSTAAVALAPCSLMDDLFAGMPADSTAWSSGQPQATAAAHRPQTLDDFF
ncbi:hypothetical protein CUR178_07954 [Leishmania enriettii]|uniref:cDENN domain-containing protein n=1 Tax=Leishmania enriettii TaxID=5663 RepID=A0A836HI13_LEIEN|nr:hypothetical protein CUR178_07954 [Leishmania enriettii]